MLLEQNKEKPDTKERAKVEGNTLDWKVMRWLKVSPPSVDQVRNSKNYILGDLDWTSLDVEMIAL